MIERGVDINTVKEIMGHSTILVTQRYLHSTNENKRRAVDLQCNPRRDASGKSGNLARRHL
jgi:site-specific recombinase XerD